MNPGRLDRTITLLAPQQVQRGDGETVANYVPYATDLPAEQINPGTRQIVAAGAQETAQRQLFRIRHRTDIRTTHRLIYEGRTYAVTSWGEDPNGSRRAYLLITAEEITPTPAHVTQP